MSFKTLPNAYLLLKPRKHANRPEPSVQSQCSPFPFIHAAGFTKPTLNKLAAILAWGGKKHHLLHSIQSIYLAIWPQRRIRFDFFFRAWIKKNHNCHQVVYHLLTLFIMMSRIKKETCSLGFFLFVFLPRTFDRFATVTEVPKSECSVLITRRSCRFFVVTVRELQLFHKCKLQVMDVYFFCCFVFFLTWSWRLLPFHFLRCRRTCQ